MLGYFTVNEALASSSGMASRFPMYMALTGTVGAVSLGTHLGEVEEGWILTASFFFAVVRDTSQAWVVFPWEFCFLDAFRLSSLH